MNKPTVEYLVIELVPIFLINNTVYQLLYLQDPPDSPEKHFGEYPFANAILLSHLYVNARYILAFFFLV